jgi:hypothetical protein
MRCFLVTGIVGIGLFTGPMTSSATSIASSSQPTPLFEKVVPRLPLGFKARANDPWGHKMGNQTAQEFAAYYGPAWIPPGLLQEGGVLDAFSEFASAKANEKSDYITVTLVRLASDADAVDLTSWFEEAQTNGLTPAPAGGTVKEVNAARIPGSEAYQSWFEGSASFDIVFARGSVVVDLDRTTPSKSVAHNFERFADDVYLNLNLGSTSLT